MNAPQRFSREYKATHIGASEWAAACGLDEWTTPMDLWARKVNLADDSLDDDANAASDLGHDMEDGIVRNAARRLGVKVLASNVTREHPTHTMLCATPDAENDDTSIIEAKMSGWFGKTRTLDSWGLEGTDEIPDGFIAQTMGTMRVLRACRDVDRRPTLAHVAALLPHKRDGVTLYRVEYDDELAAMFEARVLEFWEYVQKRKPPPADASENYSKHLARFYPKPSKQVLPSTAMTDALIADYLDAKAREDAAHKDKTYAANQITTIIGSAYGIDSPAAKATWYEVSGKKSLDMEALKAALAVEVGTEKAEALIAAATKQGKGYRAFKVTERKATTTAQEFFDR